MKKRKEKKKVVTNNQQKQLSLHSFFTPKSVKIGDTCLSNSDSAIKLNKTPTKNNVDVVCLSNPASPDVIDGTPQTKVISISRLSSKISSSDDIKLTPPKKKLFVDTSNSISDESEIVDHTNDGSNTSKHDRSCNNVLKELLEELENSPPKKQSPSSISSRDKSSKSFISLSKNKKRLKLSLSSSLKTTNAPDEHSINGSHVSCDISSNDKLHLPKIQLKDDCPESTKILDVKKYVDIFKNDNRLKSNTVSKDIECKTTSSHVLDEVNDPNCMDIENLDALFSDSSDGYELRNGLRLDEWKYCEIISIENEKYNARATLREVSDKRNASTATCLIKGYWCDSPFNIGDVVSVKAHFSVPLGCWVIDDKYGFIVKHPDILMTGTRIVESLFCSRRAVLSYLFPGGDPPNVAMLIGSLVHELLQEILRKKIYSDAEIEKVAMNLVKERRFLLLAYECGVALSTLQKELNNFLPRISSFVRTYIKNQSGKQKTWDGLINEILSIEENFWAPQLGIKGKTDLIVKATKDGRTRTMPIELKTGRVTNAVEHRGQIILYLMMMSELGMNVESGLLLYLKENIVNEIKPGRNEYTGLISMRNNLVDYFMKNEIMELSSEKTFNVPILPEPIHHHSACAKCPYLTLCSAALTNETDTRLSESNPLKKLSVNSIRHLTTNHIKYVFHWLGLLKLEEAERKRNRFSTVSDIWHLNASERQDRGFCINGLSISDVQAYEKRYLHCMKRNNDDFDFIKSDLERGDYIVVSSDKRYALAAGYVHDITKFSIVLKIDRQLDDQNILYTVDKYSATEGLLGFNTSSLLSLLENCAAAERLRSFVIDLKMPQFLSTDKFATNYSKMVSNKLNQFQKQSIFMALAAKDYVLIKGMPGTGKTATIVALIKLLVQLNHTVLLTSHTHSAVDNVLLRLKGEVEFLRLGSSARVHPLLESYCDGSVLRNMNFNTMEDLENFYDKKPVVGVTCMGCSHILLKKRTFDYCIVDEATQVLQPSVLKALFSSRKFVLLGDPDQLPPVVQSKEACRLGLDESLFKRLDRPEVVSVLSLQYRMNSEIMKLANNFTYDNQLQCDEENVCTATINVQNYDSLKFDWLRSVLSEDLESSVVFLNTSHLTMAHSTSQYSNQIEADLTCIITEALVKNCKQNYDIGVIAPYREQVHLLKKTIATKNIDIEINTVDQYQGRDKDIIIFSCTRFCEQKASKGAGILDNKHRLTVAITRAKRKLIIIGNKTVLQTSSVLTELLNFISVENVIDVSSY